MPGRWSGAVPHRDLEPGTGLGGVADTMLAGGDAIFCASDDLATGALAAVQERGFTIPATWR